ncbi:hypothetical protein [Actinoplanes couchii]|uniref:Uncharacterized protein n=1 Tax=Actinoplanes couchii TaxID=403638 RepID=A0ABQ3X518_9ACTN|nr:hypothetical protein [Actinoplanes couchii]MDR6326032.1 hypothetical protein [Actinoplanes couchii]GID53615.1 hypothetical protein Aco03nite_020190 [Actinoplanes couchii]
MVELQLELSFAVGDRGGRPLPPERLHKVGEQLMAALLDLEACNDGLRDPATSSDADLSEVTIDLLVAAESDTEAVGAALNLCRTAIHAIGASTPHWPSDPAGSADTDFRPKNVQFDYVS